jgi:hypothetical protein
LEEWLQLFGQDDVVFHVGVASAAPRLHGLEEVRGHGLASRVSGVGLLFHGREVALEQQAVFALGHSAQQRKSGLWILTWHSVPLKLNPTCAA